MNYSTGYGLTCQDRPQTLRVNTARPYLAGPGLEIKDSCKHPLLFLSPHFQTTLVRISEHLLFHFVRHVLHAIRKRKFNGFSERTCSIAPQESKNFRASLQSFKQIRHVQTT
jgi:hypothetical protein